ncbi:hypothetical protein Peur_038279 [Populus x canadensis]
MKFLGITWILVFIMVPRTDFVQASSRISLLLSSVDLGPPTPQFDVTMTVILLVAIVTSRNSRLCVCNAAKKTLNEILACSKICVAVAPGIEADNHTLSGFFSFLTVVQMQILCFQGD